MKHKRLKEKPKECGYKAEIIDRIADLHTRQYAYHDYLFKFFNVCYYEG